MNEHLTKINYLNDFEVAFTCLVFNVIIISMYIISILNNFKESYNKIKN